MIGIVDVLLPTISLSIFSLATIPALSVLRGRLSSHYRLIALVWALIPFTIAALGVLHLVFEYYGIMDSQPFVRVSLVRGYASLSSSFLIDSVSIYMAVVYLTVGAISYLYGALYIDLGRRLSERYLAIILMVTGCVFAATFSGDLLTLFIFWEASVVGSSFLIIYRRDPRSVEACLKYIIMMIISSGFIVYGLSIIYGLSGSLNFWTVREVLMTISDKRLLILAFMFVAAGYAIETAIVPFHMWLPDAYTAAPPSSSAFLSALVDQASYYVLLRVLIYILTPPIILNWPLALAIFSALTMTVGNLFAMAQSDVKRMISYVCVADIGYNLVAITSVKPLGVMGNLFFFFVGGMTTALAFMSVGVMNRLGIRTLKDFYGVGRKFPLTGLSLVISALSFSGIPPLAGFMAKYMVFTAAIEAGMAWLAVIGVLNSVLQTAYLLRLIHNMYAKPLIRKIEGGEPKILLIPIYMLVIALIVLGIYPSLILDLIYPVTKQIALLIP